MPQSLKVPILVGLETVTLTFCWPPAGTEPEEGLTQHQVPGLPGTPPEVQFSVALPVLEIRKLCVPGLAWPETPLKVNEVGFNEIVGLAGWLTFKLVPASEQLVAPFGAVQP